MSRPDEAACSYYVDGAHYYNGLRGDKHFPKDVILRCNCGLTRRFLAAHDAAPEADAVGACLHPNPLKREGEVRRWCGDCGAIYVDDYSGGEWLLPARACQPTEPGR